MSKMVQLFNFSLEFSTNNSPKMDKSQYETEYLEI